MRAAKGGVQVQRLKVHEADSCRLRSWRRRTTSTPKTSDDTVIAEIGE